MRSKKDVRGYIHQERRALAWMFHEDIVSTAMIQVHAVPASLAARTGSCPVRGTKTVADRMVVDRKAAKVGSDPANEALVQTTGMMTLASANIAG